MRLLWSRKYKSFDEWCEGEPVSLGKFRNANMVAASQSHFRGSALRCRMPFLAAGLVAKRRPMEERRSLLQQIKDLHSEQVDEWFGEPLLELIHNLESDESDDYDFFSDYRLQSALHMWSWTILGTNFGSECQHGRNRSQLHAFQKWQNFVAHTLSRESQLRMERQHRALGTVAAMAHGDGTW